MKKKYTKSEEEIKKEVSEKEKRDFEMFAIVSALISVFSSIILRMINKSLEVGNFNLFFTASIGMLGVLMLIIFIILKNKKFIVYFSQVVFLSLILYFQKYFNIDSSLKINGNGVGKIYFFIAQILFWAYAVLIIVCSIFKSKRKN